MRQAVGGWAPACEGAVLHCAVSKASTSTHFISGANAFCLPDLKCVCKYLQSQSSEGREG